ncbi:MAG: glycoside hydrolase family 16 protein [Bacteroidaceae bacterium]|nr:glycoside hydrolase family 16 protein [Bacteroidaceae bacterium]
MNRILVLAVFTLPIVFAQCNGAQKSYVPEGYELVWQDEFNEGTEPDAAKWTHVAVRSGWVNHELQNYVNHVSPGGAAVTEVKDGTLRINCFKEDGKVYSGRINGNIKTGWQHGYFEARIKLPEGKGTWPAFWMMPVGNGGMPNNGWPRCGEIDIMEEVGCVPNEVSSSIHTQDYNHTKNTQKTHAMTIDDAEGGFHIYSLLWTADEIITYVDGIEQLHVKKSELGDDHNQWPFHYPFHLILNLAWGGDWGGMHGVDEDALPITMEVDYVRVYQKK